MYVFANDVGRVVYWHLFGISEACRFIDIWVKNADHLYYVDVVLLGIL